MAQNESVIKVTATDDGATTTIENIGGAAGNAGKEIAGLRKQLSDIKKELETLDPKSAKFQELAAQAANLQNKITDVSNAINANAQDAFQGLQSNSQNLQNSLLNLDFKGIAESAKGLGQNISGINFKSLSAGVQQAGSAFVSLGKSLLTNPIFLIGAAVAAAVIYWDELTRALGFYDAEAERSAKLQADLNAEISNQTKSAGTQIAQLEALYDAVTNQTLAESERKQALQDLQTLYPDLFANQDIDINNTNALTAAKLAAVEAIKAEAKANAAKTLLEKEYAKQIELSIEQQQKQQELALKAKDESYIGAVFGLSEASDVRDRLNEINIEQQTNLKNIQDLEGMVGQTIIDGANKQAETIREKNKTRVSDNIRTNNKIADDNKKAEEDAKRAEEKLAADIAAIQEEQRLAKLSKDEVELINSQKKYDALAAQANGNAEALAQIEELRIAEEESIRTRQFEERQAQEKAREAELQAERDKANAQAIENQKVVDQLALDAMKDGVDKELALRAAKFDADIAAAEGNAEAQKLITEKYIQDVQEIEAKAQEESLKKRAENIQAWGKLTADAFGAIADLDKAFRKEDEKNSRAAFNRNKAYSIAQAIVQTGLAVTAALTAGGNPIKLATGRQFVEAGIAAAVGLAQVATIAKTQYNAGGTSGGGGGGNTSIPTASAAGGGGGGGVAQFNPLNTNFVNNRPGQVSQTYVLAGDVANAQEARNRVQDLARL